MFKNSAKTVMRNYAKPPIKVSKKLGILGVPFAKGQSKTGVDLAPDFLRENGLLTMLSKCKKLIIKNKSFFYFKKTFFFCFFPIKAI